MPDRMKIKVSNFEAIDHYDLWDNVKESKFPNRCYVSREIVNEKANVKRPYRLKLILYYDYEKDTFTLVFNGSIRKWYFGKNNCSDLTFAQFIDCIKLLSIQIGMKEQDLWNATITQLECGITLMLPLEFLNINDCYVKYRNFERTKKESTLYFNGRTSVNCLINDESENNVQNKDEEGFIKYVNYEKNLEVNKNNKNFNIENEKFTFPRFEIVVNRVSGVKFYKTKANTLFKIAKYWNEINLRTFERYRAITFVDLISKEKIIDTSKLNKRDLKKYEKFKNIIENGFWEEFEKFNASNTSTNRSTKQKLFVKNHDMFLDKKIDYQKVIWVTYKKKLARLINIHNKKLYNNIHLY